MTAAAAVVVAGVATMTDARPRRRRPSPLPVFWAAAVGFIAVFAGLALQLRAGHDPALGAAKSAAEPQRRVLVKRVIQRRVVVHPAPADDGGDDAPAPVALPAGTPAPAATTATPAAPAVQPAPAPAAPAPAPAPAPVTRSS